jgi:hypothetical protein
MTDPRTIPSFTTRLWSEEVGTAGAIEPIGADVGYRFSNGRNFAPAAYDLAVVPVLLPLDAVVVSRQAYLAATLLEGAVSLDLQASTAQGQRAIAFSGDDGGAFAAMAQGQTVAVLAGVGIDGVVSGSQAQRAVSYVGEDGMVFADTAQVQSVSAAAAVALSASVTSGQAQHGAALTVVDTGMVHSGSQAQSVAAQMQHGEMLVASSQTQTVAGAAALSASSEVGTQQGQSAAVAVGVALTVAADTSQAQRASAHAGGDSDLYVFGTTRQGQGAAATASAATVVQVSTRQGQRVSSAVAKSVGMAVSNRQGQRAAATVSVGSGSTVATRQGQSVSAAASASTGLVAGATLYVSPTGLDTNSGTIAAPLRTIQRAVTLAVAGDVVSVAPGTYAESIVGSHDGTANSPIRFVSSIKWGARIVPPASNGTKRFAFQHRGDYVQIDGFEVDGSTNPATGQIWTVGVAIYGTGAQVTRCHVHHIYRSGAADSNGGCGILVEGSDGHASMLADANQVHHCGPVGTGAAYHGLYVTAPFSLVTNNISYANAGGGIHCWHDVHDVTIANNTVFNNDSWGIIYGGGDYVLGSGPCDHMTVVNNIVVGNDTGIEELGELGTHNVVKYNQVYGSITYAYYPPLMAHTNDIVGAPGFVNYQADGSGDYHLTAGAPGVNAAYVPNAPATDFDGFARPAGGTADIGAYEYGAS